MKRIFILYLFLAGILFRLWFIQLVPQPFVFDQEQYRDIALQVFQYPLWRHTFRTHGYGFLIALIFNVFGQHNSFAWMTMQAIVDAATGLLVYAFAKKLIKKEAPALVACILYMVNPYTSALVGVMLTEIMAIFSTTLTLYLTVVFLEQKKARQFIPLGLLYGLLPQIRTPFLYISVASVSILSVLSYSIMKYKTYIKRAVVMIFILLYLLPFTYSLYGNYKWYGQIAPLIVESQFAPNIFSSLYIDRIMPYPEYFPYPDDVLTLYGEFSHATTPRERTLMAQKYLNFALMKIKSDPSKFLWSRLVKMKYVWEKHVLFTYVAEKRDAVTTFSVYWGNIALLTLALFGFVFWYRRTDAVERGVKRWFSWLLGLWIAYLTFMGTISPTEERYTLPLYPIVFLFAGYTLSLILKHLRTTARPVR